MITFNYCGYNLLFCDYSEFIVSYHLKTNFEYDHHEDIIFQYIFLGKMTMILDEILQ